MNFKRFGRLNSKKVTELKNNSPLYDIEKFFPYLPTRSKDMDQRHTISSFKTMIKKYRYCYSLYGECIAFIKQKSLADEDDCIEIDNKVYVFTNIPPYDFDNINCELLYDCKELLPIQGKKSSFHYMTTSILQNMKDRKLSSKQYKLLEDYLSKINFVSLERAHSPAHKLDEAVFTEFVWRMALFGKGIYKKSEIKEVYIKRKRSRVQDIHSIFTNFNSYDSLNNIHSFVEKINDALRYNQTTTLNKLVYEFLEEHDNTFLINEFTGDRLLKDSISIINGNIEKLLALKKNYIFLGNSYSKDYREFFKKRTSLYTLFNAQQIMRKLKKEYNSIDNRINTFSKELDKIKNSRKIIKKAHEEYSKNLGDNQLPNQGFGYQGDGWFDDSKDGLVNEIRGEAQFRLDIEETERKRVEYEREEAEIEWQMKNSIPPLELFQINEQDYFDIYKSISIKDVVEIEKLEVFVDFSLEDKFFSLQEMRDWIDKNDNILT